MIAPQLLQDELFGGPGGAAAAAQKPDRIAVLAIAYHNLGVEHEFLKQFTASLQAYTKGVEIGGSSGSQCWWFVVCADLAPVLWVPLCRLDVDQRFHNSSAPWLQLPFTSVLSTVSRPRCATAN